MTLQKDLREFIESLNALDVRFLVVGAFAVAHHGYFRYTSDIDLFVDAQRKTQSVSGRRCSSLALPI
jgi:hypothetical protein